MHAKLGGRTPRAVNQSCDEEARIPGRFGIVTNDGEIALKKDVMLPITRPSGSVVEPD